MIIAYSLNITDNDSYMYGSLDYLKYYRNCMFVCLVVIEKLSTGIILFLNLKNHFLTFHTLMTEFVSFLKE